MKVKLSLVTEWKNWKIVFLIQSNATITELNLRGNEMGATGMKALCRALSDNVFVTYLVSLHIFVTIPRILCTWRIFRYHWTKRGLISPQKSEHKNSEYFSQFSLIFIYEKTSATTLKSIIDGCVFRMCRKTMQEVTEPSIYFVCWLQTQFYFNCTLKQIISTKMKIYLFIHTG